MIESITEFVSLSDITLIMAGLVLALITLFLFLALSKLSTQSKLLSQQAEQLSVLQKECALVTSASVGMGQRISSLQAKFDSLSEKGSASSENDANVAYARALRLLDSEVDEATIMANSGLSQSEIRLMKLVSHSKVTG